MTKNNLICQISTPELLRRNEKLFQDVEDTAKHQNLQQFFGSISGTSIVEYWILSWSGWAHKAIP